LLPYYYLITVNATKELQKRFKSTFKIFISTLKIFLIKEKMIIKKKNKDIRFSNGVCDIPVFGDFLVLSLSKK
jgi:ribosomal protein S6